jgi:hypothetical protein
VLAGDDGRREAMVANGAFLSISAGPVREHTTLKAFAFDARGVSHPVPLAPSLTDETQQFRTGLPLRGPAEVERTVRGGGIGWLARREPRGEPLPEGLRGQTTLLPPGSFGRVIVPDPDDFLRIAVAVPRGDPEQICFALVMRGGVGTSCTSGPAAFARRPFTTGWTYAGSGSQFVTATGMATDEVDRLVLFLGTGENRAVALRDNVFLARVARAKFPVRLVAYDAAGRVIGVDTMLSF